MRGFPPVQLFILGLVFALLAFPLAHMTTGYDLAPEAATAKAAPADGSAQVVKGGSDHPEGEHKHVEVQTLIRLRFAHRPLKVSLKEGDVELATKADLTVSPVEFNAELEVSHEGNELMLSVTWPEGTPDTALTVELEPDGFDTRRETRWSSGSTLDEVLTFTW